MTRAAISGGLRTIEADLARARRAVARGRAAVLRGRAAMSRVPPDDRLARATALDTAEQQLDQVAERIRTAEADADRAWHLALAGGPSRADEWADAVR